MLKRRDNLRMKIPSKARAEAKRACCEMIASSFILRHSLRDVIAMNNQAHRRRVSLSDLRIQKFAPLFLLEIGLSL